MRKYMKEDYENLIAKATSKKYDIRDFTQFETNDKIISYTDEFPAQGLFLIRNPDFYKLLDGSNKVLTYSMFMIRVVSSFKQIVFETDKFTSEMKESVNNSIQNLLSVKENKKSIIVSLSLSNPPYCFKEFFTCLLHDSIIQAATYTSHDHYVRQANLFIGDYLSFCLEKYSPLTKEKWDSFICGQTSYLLDPIGEYIRYVHDHLKDKRKIFSEMKIKCDEDIKEKENQIKKSLLQLEKAMKIDDPLKYRNQFEQDSSSKEIVEDETSVIFVSNQTEYTFNDLSEFIKNKQSDKPYLEKFRNKFNNPQYKKNPDITASNTKDQLEKLEMKIQEYDRCIKNLQEVRQKIDNFPFKEFNPPENKNNKPTLDSNKANIKIDFTKADNSAFNMAAVNVDKENAIPTFSSIKADVPCILRGIQTTPICIPVYVFGNASKVNIEFHPTSQETPTPTYEMKDAQINLIFPINDIIQDMTFTGIMNINTKKIEYEVKAHFIDSVVFLDSRGNKFINHRDEIAFEKDFIAKDNINIIPEIPGEENPKQKILVENVKCQLPESPIQLKDNDKTIVFQKFSKNVLIDGITFHVYHTPLENSQVKINTPINLHDRKVFFNSLYPPYKTISEKNELEIGYTYNKYCFLVSFFMKQNY
ncbi:hypothetical protein TVAG_300660 [Trichomonas vaginalis G3]|uniref:Uncharacterized protein n=1 Tax=Trichomonas vaginalis (strain ATCC PRA-98 / G3) TaxID=412133 RepID=A2EP46_TRIV3|nr:nuclear chaperone required for maturation and nuclear export of pre-60s ribosome subunits [Trichomonas vaginalis G3]EAY05584.1 hypothetical protein TVAG_300660 [Trichomonas vaginalis G3]KAI5547512.1 nuclear chaperone required for maturation and nuclear export of pre-60s ribosome subunits [Trichomonas vaginalis G3]|eukprot:XP_001317807.1 hypothetical protein [Trichomonas vaginalis G3]